MMRIALVVTLLLLAGALWFWCAGPTQPPGRPPIPLRPAPVPPVAPAPPTSSLSPAATRILATGKESPATRDLLALRADDLAPLRKAYDACPDLAGKRALTWALAYGGDTPAAESMIQTLEADCGGRLLKRDEEQVLGETLLCLGLLAGESDRAYQYLKKAIDPAYWTARTDRNSRLGRWGKVQFVLPAIQGLGLSGRSDVDQVLRDLRGRDKDYLYHFGNSVSEAAFAVWWIRNRGRDSVLQHMREETRLSFYAAWAGGPGKDWVTWANSQRQGRKAPPLP